MKWDSDDPSAYREYSSNDRVSELYYARPEYYQQREKQSPDTVKAAPSRDSEDPYGLDDPYAANGIPYKNDKSPYDGEQMEPYRGPKSMEGYTTDVGVEQREAAQRGTMEKGAGKKRGLIGIVATVLALGSWLFKLNGLAFLLKFGWAGFSALISIAFYAFLFGWPFAIGIVALLFIHEMGHALVMKLKGIPIGAITFVPMLGAAVTMRQMPQNAQDEAEVGIAGPIAGAMASGACLLLAQMGTHPIWAPLAYFGFFINLFNLVPIVPFDGGRVLAAIDRRVWIIGFLALLVFQIWQWLQGIFSPWLLLFVVMAAVQLWSRGLKAPGTPEEKAYYNVPVGTRISLSLLYFGLIVVLVLGMSMAHSLMPITGN